MNYVIYQNRDFSVHVVYYSRACTGLASYLYTRVYPVGEHGLRVGLLLQD